jgi:RNA polymerase sigma factor (sigma-70 family)
MQLMASHPSHSRLDDLLAEADWLRGLALHVAGSEDAADELVQETWLAALKRPPIDAAQPRLWLAAVLRNLYRLSLRRDGRRRAREIRCAKPEAAPTQESASDRAFLQHRLAAEIYRLDEQTRSIVVLRYFDRLSPAQIAQQLGLSSETVRQRLLRARKQLRDRLEQDFGRDWRQRCVAAFPGAALSNPLPLSLWLMNTKLKTVAALLLILGIPLAMLWNYVGDQGTAELTSPEQAMAETEALLPDPVEATRVRVDAEPNVEPPAASTPIDPDRMLSGEVVDLFGQPVANARVTAIQPMNRQAPGVMEYWQMDERVLETVTTQIDGMFRFTLEHRKVYDVLVEAEGYALNRSLSLYAGEYLHITLEPSASVYGRVTDQVDHTPIAGVQFQLRPGPVSPGAPIRFEATSNSMGAFEFFNLPSGYYSLSAYSETHPVNNLGVGEIVLSSGEQREFPLELAPGTTIRGRVTNADTQTPIDGAEVNLRLSAPGSGTKTDPEGNFSLVAPVGMDQDNIRFRADGFGDFNYPVHKVPAEGLEVYIALRPARFAVGRILDRRGQPIAAAKLNASAYLHSTPYEMQMDDLRTRTDEFGRFEIRNLRVDMRHSLLITHENFATTVFDFPAKEWAAMNLDLGDLVMEDPASIQGKVLDLDDKPVVGVGVILNTETTRRDDLSPSLAGNEGYQGGEGFGFGRVMARTDARGRYAFSNLPAGHYYLSAGKKGYARRANGDLSLSEGENQKEVNLIFDRGLSIRGSVVDHEGKPVPSASVTLYKQTDGAPPRRLTYNLCKTDGSFLLTGLDPGNYEVKVNHWLSFSPSTRGIGMPLWETVVENVPAGTTDLRLILPERDFINGQVLGPSGLPLFGAVITTPIEQIGGIVLITSTDRDGFFKIAIPQGTSVNLEAHPPVGGADGVLRFLYDEDGNRDNSFDVAINAVKAGTENLVIRLPKLPD